MRWPHVWHRWVIVQDRTSVPGVEYRYEQCRVCGGRRIETNRALAEDAVLHARISQTLRGYQPSGPDVDLSRTHPPQVPSAARRPGSD